MQVHMGAFTVWKKIFCVIERTFSTFLAAGFNCQVKALIYMFLMKQGWYKVTVFARWDEEQNIFINIKWKL